MDPQPREPPTQPQHLAVLAQQRRSVRHGKVYKNLVVPVAAAHRGQRCHGHAMAQSVEPVQHCMGGLGHRRQTRCNLRVGEHAREFVPHAGSDQPACACTIQCRAQTTHRRIVEHQQVQHDVGVEHPWAGRRVHHRIQAVRRSRASGRADPLTMSKRNNRHSMGPFHIGTRRDSFRRILPGSLRSGVSTQAVQPA